MRLKSSILAVSAVVVLLAPLDAWARQMIEQKAPGPTEVGDAVETTADPSDARAVIPDRPWETIDVAIALDTSGSMELLLEAAKVKLWEIVQDLTLIDPMPRLRVALMTFGNSADDRETGWVKIGNDLSEDLDLVSERLFELSSEGGNEYIGRVLKRAINELSWTPSDEALKLLFVVGNERADQDPQVRLEDISDVVRQEGISLHLVFCGDLESEDAESWASLADMSLGQLFAIDHRKEPVSVKTPFDEELAGLSADINQTYIPLGEERQDQAEKLAERDEQVKEHSLSAAASRAEVKSSRMFSSSWDLVDAMEAGDVDLYELEESQLPKTLREMSLDERESYVEEMRARREELRLRISELSEERRRFVAEEMERRGIDTSRAFDTVVRQAIRDELEGAGFQVPEAERHSRSGKDD